MRFLALALTLLVFTEALLAADDGHWPPRVISSAIGVTRDGNAIPCLVDQVGLDYETDRTRILLIAGLDNSPGATDAVVDAMKWFHTSSEAVAMRKKFTVSAIPSVFPDDAKLAAPAQRQISFPPTGAAYGAIKNPESLYLWRWIGMHAPDLVIDVRHGERLSWAKPAGQLAEMGVLAKQMQVAASCAENEMVSQLSLKAACETGRIPALRATVGKDDGYGFLAELLAAATDAGYTGPSPARREIQQRLDRSPLEVALQQSRHYGGSLPRVVYIPALAVIARWRLSEMTDSQTLAEGVLAAMRPYVEGGKSTNPNSGSALSGHLVFCELAASSDGQERERYIALAKKAADLAFDEQGKLRRSMPFHNEMSDALFMGGPILARVGQLTGDQRYFEACVNHLRFMRSLVLRDDGLYRHSPLDAAAWGRGNGFPAIGMAMCLTAIPDQHPARAELLAAFKSHMRVLKKYQDPTGCWHQVIDRTESYRELTCTCMIAFAMARGVRKGWLSRDEFAPVIDRAWYAIRTRVPPNGRLVDVCTGTGKQKNLRAYYDRAAILGPDDRGGAMAMLAATELIDYLDSE